MNEYTFFYELNWWPFCIDTTPYPANHTAPELYMVRLTTKYTRNTAARKAKALVVEHVQQKIDSGELIFRNSYWVDRARRGDASAGKFIRPKIRAWNRGHPQLVRVDQPEGMK